jgi:hypothetical protein
VAIASAGILSLASAQARLQESLGRIERSIDSREAMTPVLTVEGAGL